MIYQKEQSRKEEESGKMYEKRKRGIEDEWEGLSWERGVCRGQAGKEIA